MPPLITYLPLEAKIEGGVHNGGAHNGDGGTLRHLGWNQILDI